MDAILVSPSHADLAELRREQPGLMHIPDSHRIEGTLLVSAEYNHSTESFTILPEPSGNHEAEYIHTEFEIDVNLRFQPSRFNPWPVVRETGGRVQEIMRAWEIRQIADLHCYPGDPKNVCCLGDRSLYGQEYQGRFIHQQNGRSVLLSPGIYRTARSRIRPQKTLGGIFSF